MALKERDRLDNGYLNDQMIIQAFNDTFAEIKRSPAMPRPTEQEIRTMLRPLNKNTAGFNNYRELLMHIFGADQGDKYFLMDRAQLELEAGAAGQSSNSSRFLMPTEARNAANGLM